MHRYGINIYWSDEDQVYIAEVPDLPGCITHGDSHESALANATEAIQLWVETATEFGDPIPTPKGRRLVSSPAKFSSKKQNRIERLSLRRKNNPLAPFNSRRPRVRMTPKAN